MKTSFIHEIKNKVMIISRRKKLEHFYSLFKEGMTVLDVGVSNETKRKLSDTANYFLKNFRYAGYLYTGLSIEDTDGMNELHPDKSIVQYKGDVFPFKENEFDWVFCNAVIEHVGDDDRQLKFVNEMLRVAHNVFFYNTK